MSTQDRAALRRDFEATHLDACAFVRYPGTHDQPPDPCTCGRDDVLALLDALDRYQEALTIIATAPENSDAPITVRARNIAQAALRETSDVG